MNSSSIKCPNCQSEISVDEVLRHQIEDSIKDSLRQKMLKWQQDKEKAFEQELSQKEKQLQESKVKELGLLKKERELETKLKDADLTIERKLAQERAQIWEKAAGEASERYLLREKEQTQIIESLKKSLEEAQRKATQGSQQLQGEVAELEIEQVLKVEFPTDDIIPVPKGINGADAIQKVRDQNGRAVGTIVWESKRTKNWTEGWVLKLKEDTQLAKGDLAVLVSVSLPEGFKNFGFKDGVYITNFECFLAVAKVIRGMIIKEHSIKSSVVGKNEKMEVLYSYLSGSQFRQHIEAIVEAFSSMKGDLEMEKRAFQKMWAKREKEIERVISNTVGMHGDLQGLIGASLPQIKGLELDSLEIISSEVVVGTDKKTVIQTEMVSIKESVQ